MALCSFQTTDLRAGVSGELIDSLLVVEAENETGEAAAQPGNLGNRPEQRHTGVLKMIGLHPDPRLGHGRAPVLLDVAASAGHVDGFAVDGDLSVHRVVEAQHAVIALHKRHKAIPSHRAGGKQAHRPAHDVVQREVGRDLVGAIVHRQVDFVQRKRGIADFEREWIIRRRKRRHRIGVVLRSAFVAGEDLNESVGAVLGQGDAGDQRERVLFGAIDEFEVPAFKVVFLLQIALEERGAVDFHWECFNRVCTCIKVNAQKDSTQEHPHIFDRNLSLLTIHAHIPVELHYGLPLHPRTRSHTVFECQ